MDKESSPPRPSPPWSSQLILRVPELGRGRTLDLKAAKASAACGGARQIRLEPRDGHDSARLQGAPRERGAAGAGPGQKPLRAAAGTWAPCACASTAQVMATRWAPGQRLQVPGAQVLLLVGSQVGLSARPAGTRAGPEAPEYVCASGRPGSRY